MQPYPKSKDFSSCLQSISYSLMKKEKSAKLSFWTKGFIHVCVSGIVRKRLVELSIIYFR